LGADGRRREDSARPGKERENRRFANPPAAVGHRPPAHVFTQFALRFRLAKLYNQEAMRAGSAAVPPLAVWEDQRV